MPMPKTAQIPDPRITWPPTNFPATAKVFAQNTVSIAAPPETIWTLLIDCKSWPSWYKHCSDVSILQGGQHLSPGAKFRFKTLDLYFEPEVITFEPNRLLVWRAKGPLGTSGAHAWLIEPTQSGCRVTTEEAQTGLLLTLIAARTRTRLLTAHEHWLQALKTLAQHPI